MCIAGGASIEGGATERKLFAYWKLECCTSEFERRRVESTAAAAAKKKWISRKDYERDGGKGEEWEISAWQCAANGY